MEANRMSLRATALLLLLALAFAASATASPAGNAARGKQKAAPCAACHGDGNKTLNDTYPKLAGQYPDYLSKALHEYKNGKRKNPIMGAQAAPLDDQDIADLAAYFAAQPAQIHDLSGHAR
jgi:cytochrome c553